MNSPLLSIKNLSYTVANKQEKILDAISLTIKRRDFLVVVGSNGSGKSSLLKCVNGLYGPQEGSVEFDGASLSGLSFETIGKSITTLTQDLSSATFGDLTVLENCRCAALMRNQKISRREVMVHLQQFHPALAQKLNQYAFDLSGGERQCLALAMGLLHPPKLLLLDEHTSALDPQIAKHVMELTYQNTENIAVVMTTHNLNDALQYGNRLIMMNRGKIIFEAEGEEKKALTKKELLELYG